jgi:carbamoyl-phosphate synthase large subunit
MGIDTDFPAAFAKAQIAAGDVLPVEGCVFVSVRDADKEAMVEPIAALIAMGFRILATGGTAATLTAKGLEVERVNKVAEGRPSIVDEMLNKKVHLVFNTTEGAQSIRDSFSIRRTALAQDIPYYTTISAARAAIQAIARLRKGDLDVRALQTYT